MEDIDGEGVLDIDGCDANNALAVVEYIEDLHSYYRKIEVTVMKIFAVRVQFHNVRYIICIRVVC